VLGIKAKVLICTGSHAPCVIVFIRGYEDIGKSDNPAFELCRHSSIVGQNFGLRQILDLRASSKILDLRSGPPANFGPPASAKYKCAYPGSRRPASGPPPKFGPPGLQLNFGPPPSGGLRRSKCPTMHSSRVWVVVVLWQDVGITQVEALRRKIRSMNCNFYCLVICFPRASNFLPEANVPPREAKLPD